MVLIFATLMFIASLIAMRARYGTQWILRPFSLFIFTAAIYHVVSEWIVKVTHTQPGYRVSVEWTDKGALVAGTAIVAMTIGYMATHAPVAIDTDVNLQKLADSFDWRVLAALLAPIFFLTARGQGFQSQQTVSQGISDVGFAQQFFVPLTVLTGFALLVRFPRRLIPILFGCALALSIAGQRLEIVVVSVTLLIAARRIGITVKWRQVTVAALVAALLGLAISTARSEQGRAVFDAGTGTSLSTRLTALADGVLHPTYDPVHRDVGGRSGVVQDFGLRMDSDAFVGAIKAQFDESDAKPQGVSVIVRSMLMAVPSALYPAKLHGDVWTRDPETEAVSVIGIAYTDYLPGALTTYYGDLGWMRLLLFDFLLGALLGACELWSLRRNTAARMVIYASLATAALYFEKGLLVYPIVLRGALIVIAVLWLSSLLRPRLGKVAGPGRRAGRSAPGRYPLHRSGSRAIPRATGAR